MRETVLIVSDPHVRGGEPTIGASRVTAATALLVIRAHGVEEAKLMWPHIPAEELDVLAAVAAGLNDEEDDDG